MYDVRRSRCRRPRKLAEGGALHDWVRRKLVHQLWSREQMAARLRAMTPDLIAKVLTAAKLDTEKGVYYAAPFFMGTRPSEQLGLLWDAVDFEANLIRICRIQLKDGSLSEMTKTSAGMREIPMSAELR